MMPWRQGNLEILHHPPHGPERPVSLLFVHGAYTAAWCWEEYFLPYFAARGFDARAVSLSGHGHSRGRMYLDSLSIADYVADVVEVVETLAAPPVLIGHSMGGMVVQKYLEQHVAAGAVMMASVPPQGLLGSAFGLAFSRPQLLGDLNRIMGSNGPGLETIRQAMFHEAVELDRLRRYAHLCQPESHRALWDMSLFGLPRLSRIQQPPMLVMGAEHDVLIPPSQVGLSARHYGLEPLIVPGMGHGMMLEPSWENAARPLLDWLESVDF